jgi:hypothetical protein
LAGLAAGLGVRAEPAVAQRSPVVLPATDSAAIVALRLSDGSELTGRVLERDDTSLTVVTIAGLRVVAPRRAIVGWRPVRGRIVSGALREADPNTSRLFFAPTGRTLRSGSGYFADYFLFFPFLAVGLTDFITVAGGMSLFPGARTQLLYFAPKVAVYQGPQAAFSIGGIYATIPEEAEGGVGAGYAVATLGSEDNAVTVLAGWPFADGETADEPGFMFGAEGRVSNRSKLLLELWKLPGSDVLPAIFGVRFFGSRLTVDFGLIYAIGADAPGFPFFPWVDFVVSW